MLYSILFLSAFLNAATSVLGKYYNRKSDGSGKAVSEYNVLFSFAVFICWCILFAFNFSFDARVLLYSILFAFFFAVFNLGLICALKYGPVSLTSLFISLSLILVTIWGFIFWNSVFNFAVIIGLVLVVVAIFLCLIKSDKSDKSISLKWIIFALFAMVGNAGCAIVQKTQQIDFSGNYGEMLMVIATFLSFLMFAAYHLIYSKGQVKITIKSSSVFPVLAGVGNVALNMFVIILATSEISPNLIYPVIGVGGLIISILYSLLTFKEKLKWSQWLGVVVGIVAIMLLA